MVSQFFGVWLVDVNECVAHGAFLATFCNIELVRLVKGTARNSPIKAGDYFGHEVMIDHQKYLATVVSLQTTTGWKISRANLNKAVDIEKLNKAPRKKG